MTLELKKNSKELVIISNYAPNDDEIKTKPEPENLVLTVKHGECVVIVWGSMIVGVGNLAFIETVMDHKIYIFEHFLITI